ncbi:hypothetical protein mflW37_1000 [Mesoplasma florum W37]|uniref:Transmembrane protein n=1 Tax=Mesoplasma florum TaxID=2151 RepID=A0AAD0HT08_MESFO|nr:hypothetical protein [Mesoplasma florum]AGY41167.1 hypothetical protein mflW37_1000 [Mesoplasma florum W37]AVN59398.1 hypothetical protein CG008_00500 [Mesoplasma florum]AVN65505.1 putative transmembrane protein [Mesoplasma florum]
MAKNELKNLKKLRKEGLNHHYKDINKELNSDLKAAENYTKMKNFRENKKFNWVSWVSILGITLIGIGLSFGLGYAFKDVASFAPNITSKKRFIDATAFVATAYLCIEVLAIFIINYIRNRKAINYFNDKRLRYQKTYTKEEAVLIRWRNTITFCLLPFLVFMIIMYTV